MLVIEGEGLVVIVDFGQVGIGENLGQHPPFGADARLDLAVGFAGPAALPLFLVFPILGIADARLGLDIVEPGVFDAFAAGPHVLAGDRTGVAADAFVEVQHHRDLCADFHGKELLFRRCGERAARGAVFGFVEGFSSQSTFDNLRMMTNSSRLVPMVP